MKIMKETGIKFYKTMVVSFTYFSSKLSREESKTLDDFHHVIFNNPTFYEPSVSCKCTLCGQLCDRYHKEGCSKKTRTIKDSASQDASVKLQ